MFDSVRRFVISGLPNRKVAVEILMHPRDLETAQTAARSLGMDFHDFCALAIHKETLTLGGRHGRS